jgi:MoxR-like ATPase
MGRVNTLPESSRATPTSQVSASSTLATSASGPIASPAGSAAGAPDAASLAAVDEVKVARQEILREIEKRIIGQHQVIDQLLVALFARGHCLFVGVPGLAKTLLISTLAEVLTLRFSRIQFTPDLMPSDITGSDILEEDHVTGKRAFRFIRGPIFANIVLADEINRTPPKTQAALLQSMQEGRVTAGGQTHPLDPPFLVFATQNPIEQEGTYPLPEAQLDRFMLQVDVTYPTLEEEVQIVKRGTSADKPNIKKVLSPERILALQELVLRVPAADHVVRYAVNLVHASRPQQKAGGRAKSSGGIKVMGSGKEAETQAMVNEYLAYGAGPRASQYLILGAKARAILDGRPAASVEDVKALARPTLQHRLIPNFHAEAEGVRPQAIIERLLDSVKS